MRHSARVLVVDDEQQVKAAFCRVLDRAGYETSGAESAEEALELIRESEYDLVITDIVMDGIDGVEFLSRLRKQRIDLPVVMVTAYSKEEYEESAREKGAFAYLRKPVSRERLLSVTSEALVTANGPHVPSESPGFP